MTPGTLQRRDSLCDILNYSSETSPVLFLLVPMARSNAGWQLASSDLRCDQIVMTGVLSPRGKNRTRFLPRFCPRLEQVTHQLEVAFREASCKSTDRWSFLSKGCAVICGTGVHIPLSPTNDQPREVKTMDSPQPKSKQTCVCMYWGSKSVIRML